MSSNQQIRILAKPTQSGQLFQEVGCESRSTLKGLWFRESDKRGVGILGIASLASLKATRGGNRGVNARLIIKIQEILDDSTITRDRKIHELDKKLQDLDDNIKTAERLDLVILQRLQRMRWKTRLQTHTTPTWSYTTFVTRRSTSLRGKRKKKTTRKPLIKQQ